MMRLLALPGLAPASLGTLLLFAIGVVSVRALRKRLSYEQWHVFHLTAYIGAGLAFSHQLAGPIWRDGRRARFCGACCMHTRMLS